MILLTLLMIGQSNLAFDYAMEESVMRIVHVTHIPTPIRNELYKLGLPEWRDREKQSNKLYEYYQNNLAERRWLFWGRKFHDKEISLRCNQLIRRIYRCEECRGNGGTFSAYGVMECSSCHQGSKWGLAPWN